VGTCHLERVIWDVLGVCRGGGGRACTYAEDHAGGEYYAVGCDLYADVKP